jgi:hypothetical protein
MRQYFWKTATELKWWPRSFRHSLASGNDRWFRCGRFLLVLCAFFVTIRPFYGQVVADARFEHLSDPWQFVLRHFQIWDDSRGPGGPSQLFSPVVGLIEAGLKACSVPTWLIGRVVLALYLSVTGISVMHLYRAIFGDAQINAVVAGFLYAFNAYTTQNLVPSGLFLAYALSPLLVLITLKGCSADKNGKWCALFALLVFTFGALNTASLIYMLLGTLIFVSSVCCFEKEIRFRSILKFFTKATLLSLLTCSAAIFVLSASSGTITANLGSTESFSLTAKATSPTEIIRGMGNWLSYFSARGIQEKSAPELITSRFWTLSTFLTPLFALIALTRSHLRWRRTFIFIIVISLVIVGGSHSPTSSPIAGLYQWMFTNVPSFRSFRSTVKFSWMLILVTSMLAPIGAQILFLKIKNTKRNISRILERRLLILRAALLLTLTAVSLSPILILGPFAPSRSYDQIPKYWSNLFDFFEDKPSTDRVLILPGFSRTNYQWGFINDNIFDSLLKPQALQTNTLSSTTYELSSLITETDQSITESEIVDDGVIGLLKILKVQWLIVQNDTSYPGINSIDLSGLSGLRFVGRYGLFKTKNPVEVYKVENVDNSFTYSDLPPALVSGGEGSMIHLSRSGWLSSPVVNLTTLDQENLLQFLQNGSDIVVADGSQRRVVVRSQRPSISRVFLPNESANRPIATADPINERTMTVRLPSRLNPYRISEDQELYRIPTELGDLPPNFKNPVSYVFGEFFDDLPGSRIARQFGTVRDQQFVISGQLRIDGLLGVSVGECFPLFKIDDQQVDVKVMEIANEKNRVNFSACETIELPMGAHFFTELPMISGQVLTVSFRDKNSQNFEAGAITKLDSGRLSSSKFSIEKSTLNGGYVYTTVPFHPQWKIKVGNVSVTPFSANGNLGFAKPYGTNGNTTLEFAGQLWYLVAIGLTISGLILNSVIIFTNRRLK